MCKFIFIMGGKDEKDYIQSYDPGWYRLDHLSVRMRWLIEFDIIGFDIKAKHLFYLFRLFGTGVQQFNPVVSFCNNA